MSKFLGTLLTIFSGALNRTTGRRKTTFERVTDAESLQHFQRLFSEKEKISLPLEYLSRASVYFCKNEFDNIVGGFAVVLSGPFRAIKQVPGKVTLPTNLRLEEINGVWLDTTTCVHRRIRFWSFLVGTVLRKPGNSIVYAVDAHKLSLRETLFNRIRTWTIFEGVVDNLEGMSATGKSVEAVEIAMKSRLSLEIIRYLYTYCSDIVLHRTKRKIRANKRISFTLHRKTPRVSLTAERMSK